MAKKTKAKNAKKAPAKRSKTMAAKMGRLENAVDKDINSVITDELNAGAVVKPRRRRAR